MGAERNWNTEFLLASYPQNGYEWAVYGAIKKNYGINDLVISLRRKAIQTLISIIHDSRASEDERDECKRILSSYGILYR